MSYAQVPNHALVGANGVKYTYRETGEGGVPLVLLQRFRGNLDDWDPALVDRLAASRRVVTFDNTGVGGSSGTTPHTVAEMARDANSFLDSAGLDHVDLLGFSLGSFVAQEVTLTRPSRVRRLVLASAAPQGAAGMHGWASEVIDAVGARNTNVERVLDVFYAPSSASRGAGKQSLRRMFTRTEDRDTPSTWETRVAQYDAVTEWGIPNHALLQRVGAITTPTFITNGDSDPMILPRYSYLLAGLIPHAQIKIYRDAAHGFLFQHHAEFAADVETFLS